MSKTKPLSLEEQLAVLQAQVIALETEKQSLVEDNKSLVKDKQTLIEDKAEMQTRIDNLLAELKLSKSQKYGKKSEKTPRGTFNEAEQHQVKSEPKHHKKGKQVLAETLNEKKLSTR